MDALALTAYSLGVAVAFGGRSWLQRRRTGSAGFNGFSGAPWSLERAAGVLFAAAVVAGLLAPALAVTGVLGTLALLDGTGTRVAGLGLVLAGFTGTVASQAAMGNSWRIGVDEAERTDLVTSGLFARVRNPIFTAMLTAQAGLALAVPNALSLAALAALLLAVQVQVRRVEEPYLLRTHGGAYRAYAARTGRFLPGLGRLRAAGREAAHAGTTAG
ncbi:protein-S-isoprenylcysteine O-methyltransferase Ste14 [Kineococcus xinjiangensis]|uniref:Protein-S-isoprenylcysteine O-methyltransferase Ste14 n=1 Tax=Kineococcus xinjiangensis TaxID=512762 RepID=A0A2S6IVG1_9ACTN|nr:isoprenylcysteine carboxylmethyltransferase family protein [Kineococcus xinjiangensis]PPK98179.1 protein-S-isoprenylcysteine O-methyltransferase Ste14 [Kineococcus xinjiangensis]